MKAKTGTEKVIVITVADVKSVRESGTKAIAASDAISVQLVKLAETKGVTTRSGKANKKAFAKALWLALFPDAHKLSDLTGKDKALYGAIRQALSRASLTPATKAKAATEKEPILETSMQGAFSSEVMDAVQKLVCTFSDKHNISRDKVYAAVIEDVAETIS